MKIKRIQYRGWPEAYHCQSGQLELIVVTSIGPRVLSLRFNGGDNLLYEDTTAFSVGAWKMYGGHRFTVAPETERSYTPDNQPCEARVIDGVLWIYAAPSGGISRELEIRASDGDGFQIRGILRNTGLTDWRGATWFVTCVPARGVVIAPVPVEAQLKFWPVEQDDQPGQLEAAVQREDRRLRFMPVTQRGKAGWFSRENWIRHTCDRVAFTIQGPRVKEGSEHPDGNCNVELFACEEYFELETLGPLVTLQPGCEVIHEEKWSVSAVANGGPGFGSDDNTSIGTA